MPLLSIIIFTPLVAALFLLFVLPREDKSAAAQIALVASLIIFVLSLWLAVGYVPQGLDHQFQHVEQIEWLPAIGASYYLAADGLSLILATLTAFLMVLICINNLKPGVSYSRNYWALLLTLTTGVLGSFFALDLLLFYVFWELMLIPLYFLIAFWGSENRMYASIKFFAFTLAGSLLMLVGFVALYFLHEQMRGFPSFNVLDFYAWHEAAMADPDVEYLSAAAQGWIFLALFLGFAVKIPVFPMHTWLPDAHTEAPTAGSVILAGVLLKAGVYGFLRFSLPVLPEASTSWSWTFAVLGILGILVGSLAAIAQQDAKRLVAYSSVGHMGLIVLGLAALNMQSLQGASIQMVNHGLATGGLFLCVGMLYDRRHTRLIRDYGGIAKVMPVFAVMFTLIILSSVGLPGLCGFVGEAIILFGVAAENMGWAAFAVLGVILSAVYLLWMYQRVMQGDVTHEENRNLKDIGLAEVLTLLPIVLVSAWIGLYPQPILERLEPTTERILVATDRVETPLEIHAGEAHAAVDAGTEH